MTPDGTSDTRRVEMVPRIVCFEDWAPVHCPYFVDKRGLPPCRCTHPENEEREIIAFQPGPVHVDIAACYIFTCPLGACLHPETDPEDVELMKRYGFDPEGCSDEVWLELVLDPNSQPPRTGGSE